MHATAAQQSDSADEPRLASVVDLSTRRDGKTTPVGPAPDTDGDAELREHIRQHWANTFAQAGLELGSPQSVKILKVVTGELERLVGGLLVIREGNDHLPANPQAGVDFTSAVEVTGILRDLRGTAETLRADHQG